MAQAQKGNSGAVSGLDNLSYLNSNEPAQVLRITATRNPTTNDRRYKIGSIWINTSSNVAWILTSVVIGSATWAIASPGASDVDTLTGDGGGAISPVAGNITLTGGTNITTAGTAGTITYNLDGAIVLATSITSPLYTVGAAADLLITSATGQDIIIKMGDNAAANKVSFTDSDDAEVFSIDSNGGIPAVAGLTVTGAFTQTAGAVSISEDNSANAVGIANGTTARAITIGSSAAAHTITIGSATGAASLDLVAGTGNFTLDGAGATTYTVGATTTTGTIDIGGTSQTGTMTLGDSDGINIVQIGSGEGATTVNIAGGATAAKVVNIADGAVANLVTIGTVSGAASMDLLVGTGNFTLEGAVTSTYDISNTGINTGTVNIAGGTGARAINIGAGGTGAKTIGIGAGASADVITIGTDDGASSLDLVCGTGNFTLEGSVTATYGISTTGANTGTITIGGGTAAQQLDMMNSTGGKTINLGAGAGANVITIGSVTGASQLDLLCGSGDFSLDGDAASDMIIGASLTGGAITIGGTSQTATLTLGDSDGVNLVDIGAGEGATTVGIATGATAGKFVNIATGAVANAVVIGSVSGASSLGLLAGTGNFTLEGNVATTYDISAVGVNTGAITIGGGTGAQTLNMMNAAGGKTVTLASGAGANTVTIGSINTTSATTIQAGTGNITMTGTINRLDSKFSVPTGIDINFNQSPHTETNANTGGIATGATGDVNLMALQEGVLMEQFIIGAGQTIIAPRMTATGLLTSLDLTNAEGAEYNFGAARNNSRHAFTIGTSAAFFMEMAINLADVSGLEPLLMGFRLVQANDADYTNYTDFASIGTNDGVSPGDATIQTQLNTGGVVSTDTNDAWANGATLTLRVNVSAAGVVTFTIDGAPPTATQAFTFDNGDIVVPFVHHLFNAVAPGAINWVSMQIGFQ